MTELDDIELLELWRAHRDRAAGNTLFDRYHEQLSRFFSNQVGDAERGDLTQETFARMLKAAHGFEGRSSFRSFLFAIAHNVLNEFLRARYKRGKFDPDVHSLKDVDELTPSRVISKLLRKHVLVQCLRTLPVDKKLLLELYYWQELDAGELGAMLGIPEATVRSRVFAAKNKLRALVAAKQPNLGDLDLERQLESLRELLGSGPSKF